MARLFRRARGAEGEEEFFTWEFRACPFGLFKRGLTVALGTVEWCRSSSGTGFDISETAGFELAYMAVSMNWGFLF